MSNRWSHEANIEDTSIRAATSVDEKYGSDVATVLPEGPPVPPVAETLRWVVAGFRVLSWIWVLIYTGLIFVDPDEPGHRGILWSAVAIATIWTAVTLWAARSDERMRRPWFLVGDTLIALSLGAASVLAGAADLIQASWPNSWLFVVAYVFNLRWTLLAALVLIVENVPLHLLHGFELRRTAGTYQFLLFAVLAGWAFDTLRNREALRLEAEAKLADEQRANTRYEARVELARRLHDSYLQTLVSTRAAADDANRVRYLTRRQERELRRTIAEFGSPFEKSFKAALMRCRDEVVELYPTHEIDEVIRDDAELTPALEAGLAAAREAMLNAVKHSGTATVDLYSEKEAGAMVIHVRDRGVGFDQEAVGTRGLSLSIVKPVEKVGGDVWLETAPGEGTEVAIRVPVDV